MDLPVPLGGRRSLGLDWLEWAMATSKRDPSELTAIERSILETCEQAYARVFNDMIVDGSVIESKEEK